MSERRIIHIDMDYFFAQVEMRDKPELKGKPVIVGGKASGRGVVSTASYEARKFGVHSAMPMAQAHKLCPDGYYVQPRFEVYKETSQIIMDIFKSYTEIVEPMSLDEAYLDITHLVRPDLSASAIAQFIRRDICEKTGLTSSAGISYNKFLAKLASGMNKPNGITVIHYNNVNDILMNLDIGDFPGVGKATKEVMHANSIYNGQDLYNKDERELIRIFGKRGHGLYQKARGIDHKPVKNFRIRKSVGTERTFATDINDDEEILLKVRELSEKTAERLSRIQKSGKTVTVKIKTYQFETLSRQRSLRDPIRSDIDIYNTAYSLYNELKDPDVPIRLIGVTVGNLETTEYQNMSIYDFL
ncbi:DNA polymerase IV [Staphylococcus condimenti]|uniref:DNA polymerase IV n=1 Tax=Staphylococcus condimenti TaxID=70255 RepID=A0A143PE67_9STAP|nr:MULTISPECIES: DNA polymerase IV [Staphylococcus]AMY06746.1 DNA polymerase IV [Staphylococcus condimenti]APR60650.1 DNA polymerase IV [Staphylococcus condimenti]MDK8645570.1 DNA polymerase IV [Staphylococcus condimenti]OFP00411.1 DNA polymerase IV [Staphylococcus sp. HMSC065E08]PNZ60653.1 DNA polymerase IV [Staphylococcus condimenti]